MSSPELIDAEGDVADEDIPPHSPPEYETITLEDGRDAPPDYASPIERKPVPHAVDNSVEQGEAKNLRISMLGRSITATNRGVGGVPQLPSLRLGALPSIVVDAGSPISARGEDSQLP